MLPTSDAEMFGPSTRQYHQNNYRHQNTETDLTCTYRGIIGADGVATEDGIDPKALSGGVWVAVDVQDAALLEVVHVSSLHFQRA
jgi:hypothetical protein